jgi:hypothetical protein
MLLAKTTTGWWAVLVRTGLGESFLREYGNTWSDFKANFIADDVLEAAQWIVKEEIGKR